MLASIVTINWQSILSNDGNPAKSLQKRQFFVEGARIN
jgi:hypothetical protein